MRGTQQRPDLDRRVVAEPPKALVDDRPVRVVDAEDRDRPPVQVILYARLPRRDHLGGQASGERAEIPDPAARRRHRVQILRQPQILRAKTTRQGGVPPPRRRRHAPETPHPPPDQLDRRHRYHLVEPSDERRERRAESCVNRQRLRKHGHIEPRHRSPDEVLQPRRVVCQQGERRPPARQARRVDAPHPMRVSRPE